MCACVCVCCLRVHSCVCARVRWPLCLALISVLRTVCSCNCLLDQSCVAHIAVVTCNYSYSNWQYDIIAYTPNVLIELEPSVCLCLCVVLCVCAHAHVRGVCMCVCFRLIHTFNYLGVLCCVLQASHSSKRFKLATHPASSSLTSRRKPTLLVCLCVCVCVHLARSS